MEALFHTTSSVAALAASTLFSAIWEGTVLAACVVLCLRLLPGLSAAARSLVWMNVFLLLVLLQVVPYLGAHMSAASTGRPAPFQLNLLWSIVIAAVWLVLSLFRGMQLISSAIRLHQLAKRAILVDADPALRTMLQIRTIGGKAVRAAELCTSTEVQRPSVFGFFHPRILIPPALLDRLTAEELRQVVLHEMEHLRRADDWTNLLQKMALVVFPLNPALLWVERRLCAERELACDDSVLRSSCGRKAYALCLTHLAEYSMLRRGLSLALGAWERQSELVRRVHRILRRPNKSMSARQTMVLTGSLTLAGLLCAIALARSPQLVSFARPAPSPAQANLLPLPVLREPSLEQPNLEQAGPSAHVQLVKAVMPLSPLQYRSTAKPTDPANPARRNAALRSPRRHYAAPQQAWVVMTEWTDTEAAPHVVFTVEQGDTNSVRRASYAAVPLANGWLFIQI
jgi:beta-lactamase regulating signal transducer with metallopeptidase domain